MYLVGERPSVTCQRPGPIIIVKERHRELEYCEVEACLSNGCCQEATPGPTNRWIRARHSKKKHNCSDQ